MSSNREDQGRIWDFYKPRHTHSWNMLVLSWRELDESTFDANESHGFETEYRWENFILRLWLYRATVKTLTKLQVVEHEANNALKLFDNVFNQHGRNALKALRDMIEHFDDYAAGVGRGPAIRETDLDPRRAVSKDQFERGRWLLERGRSYDAAIALRANAKSASDNFIAWYKSGAE